MRHGNWFRDFNSPHCPCPRLFVARLRAVHFYVQTSGRQHVGPVVDANQLEFAAQAGFVFPISGSKKIFNRSAI